MNPEEVIAAYVAGPAALKAAVSDLTAEQWHAAPVPGKWSTQQVVCHLADFELVYADRMKRVIAEECPTLFGGDPDLFAAKLSYEHRDAATELCLIECIRSQMATILRRLPVEAFERTGRHSADGPLTLAELLRRITHHIPHHLETVKEKRRALGLP